MTSKPQGIFQEIVQRIARSGDPRDPKPDDFPQWMRRCFMTGKQCIFCPQETVFEDTGEGKRRDSAFVIMPFTANLSTFYEWSLKPYLASFGIDPQRIRRADQFTDTGYVMCEKICLRIQQAGLIVVDLSIVNPNVYYELGIAVGLNKPILPICDGRRWEDKPQDESLSIKLFCNAVGIDPNKVLRYPSVGHLDAKKVNLLDYIIKVPLRVRRTAPRIISVLARDEQEAIDRYEVSKNAPKDIEVDFQRALEAAVGVAVRTLQYKAGYLPGLSNGAAQAASASPELTAAFASMSADEFENLSQCKHEHLTNETRTPQPYDKIANLVDDSLISIVDLASENPLAYFWLGYTHGRNINVIPIFRSKESPPVVSDQKGETIVKKPTVDHVLAFDIRALWYMKHEKERTRELAEKLGAVLEPILVRDVTTQQRRTFWERLTRSGRVHIYNGAVHHRELNREVVGDWDLRTASELISYLSSTDESVVPVLQSPIYAPETIAEKLGVNAPDEAFLASYVAEVRRELAGKNCVILASADVNPITEVVLAHIYHQRGSEQGKLECFCVSNDGRDKTTVISVKGEPSRPAPIEPGVRESADRVSPINFALPRRFSRMISNTTKRGFMVDGTLHTLDYYSQDQSDKAFSILAHLVVARNPFTPEENLIVILNGVSGPATFGLAEILTGGAGGTKAKDSESLLKMINQVWTNQVESTLVARGHQPLGRYNGLEAILKIDISPPEAETETQTKEERALSSFGIKNKFYDKRSVVGWSYFETTHEDFWRGNPRPFPIG